MKLSIILVNWNSVDYLRGCLASIYENTSGMDFEVIVIDNASPKPGVEKLVDEFPQVQLILSQKNLGFAGANNVAFRQSTGEYVVFLNPDTKLVGPTLNTLVQQLEILPDAGVVGCKMLNTDLSVQITSIQKFPTILNQVLTSEYLQLKWPKCPLWDIGPLFENQLQPLQVEVIPGALMALRRSVFQEVKMFSEAYFMYGEDLDLNFKLKRAGYKNYYIGFATIIHHGGKSSSQQKVSQWATLMKFRAMLCLFEEMRGKPYAELYRVTMGVAALARIVILAMVYPVSALVDGRLRIQNALEKWKTVLQWSLGDQASSKGN